MDSTQIALVVVLIGVVVYWKMGKKESGNDNEMSKILPIKQIEDKVMISSDGIVTFSFILELPWVFTLTREDQHELYKAWMSFVDMLPLETTLHKQEYVWVDKKDIHLNARMGYTEKENIKKFLYRKLPYHKSYLHISFPIEGIKKKSDNVFVLPFEISANILADLNRKIKDVENALMSMPRTTAVRLDNEALKDILEQYWNLSFEGDVRKDYIDSIKANKDELIVGGKFVKIYSMVEEPEGLASFKIPEVINPKIIDESFAMEQKQSMYATFLYPIVLGLPINHITNLIIQKKDNDQIISELGSVKMKLNPLFSLKHLGAVYKTNEIDDFIMYLTKEGMSAAKTAINVIAFSDVRNDLEEKSNLIRKSFDNLNRSKICIENVESFEVFRESSPGYAHKNRKMFINTTEQSISYITKEGVLNGMDEGVLFSDDFGKPFYFNLFDNPFTNVKHMCIFGMTRAGKSVFSNHIIDSYFPKGAHVVIVDNDNSYRNNCLANNGKYIDTANLKTNIFKLCEIDNGKYIYQTKMKVKDDEDVRERDYHLNFVIGVIQTIWMGNRELDNDSKQVLKDAIIDYYDYVNSTGVDIDMKGFYEYTVKYESTIEVKDDSHGKLDFSSLRLSLKDYAIGEFSYLFNAKENDDYLSNRFIVFDAKGVSGNPQLFNLVSLIIVRIATYKIEQLPRNIIKIFMIDEAMDFIKKESAVMAENIAGGYRKYGKQNGIMIISTQSVEFLNSASQSVKDSIVNNTGVLAVLGSGGKESVVMSLKSFFNLSYSQCEMIMNMNPDGSNNQFRKAFIKIENFAFTPRVELSKRTLVTYSTTAQEMMIIAERVKKNGGNVKLAVEDYVDELEEKEIN